MRKVAVVTVIASVMLTLIAGPVWAHRSPTNSEFRSISAAVKKASDGFLCAQRAATFVSTRDSHWALAIAIGNCGEGSLVYHEFLRRRSARTTHWTVITHLTTTGRITVRAPCMSREVPADIRCLQ